MSTETDEERLDALAAQFVEALRDKEAGRLDDAEDTLRAILAAEPRLAEPRMELARILLDTDRITDAEDHAREALVHLEGSGVWTEELPEDTVRSVAHALLAEVLRRRADDDDVIFGDPGEFKRIVAESHHHFSEAARLDPSDETSSYYAVFMGPKETEPPDELDD